MVEGWYVNLLQCKQLSIIHILRKKDINWPTINNKLHWLSFSCKNNARGLLVLFREKNRKFITINNAQNQLLPNKKLFISTFRLIVLIMCVNWRNLDQELDNIIWIYSSLFVLGDILEYCLTSRLCNVSLMVLEQRALSSSLVMSESSLSSNDPSFGEIFNNCFFRCRFSDCKWP